MDRYKVWHLKSKEMGCQQVYFLIDLENVHNPGMAGAEYLEPQDTLLFFTVSRRNIWNTDICWMWSAQAVH